MKVNQYVVSAAHPNTYYTIVIREDGTGYYSDSIEPLKLYSYPGWAAMRYLDTYRDKVISALEWDDGVEIPQS